MRLRNNHPIEFLGTWEMIHNPNLKVVEFETIECKQEGGKSFCPVCL